MQQGTLFDLEPSADVPEGLRYEPLFLDLDEERFLLDLIQGLPLTEAVYKGHLARRQVLSFGGSFDFDTHTLRSAPPLVEALHPLRRKVAEWAGLRPEQLVQTLVAHYPPSAPLGWHRDVPDFEAVFGVSLGAPAVLRFRPYPPVKPRPSDIRRLVAEARSIYALRGPARWAWQHSLAALEAPRSSITFRTARIGPR
ncbi:MAG: hypothetical protein EOP40_03885 [Rubrivivax sp.]|nr:MAG: hypothetical protein EOP40_03885 [Rubrivivax sp.]